MVVTQFKPKSKKPKVLKTAFVLAAGKGTRLKPLTDTCPKPLISVAGQPALLRILHQLEEAGVEEVVINLQYLGDQIEHAIWMAQMAGQLQRLNIQFSYEADLLETGGGLKHALPLLPDGPFYVINSDAIWDELHAPVLPQLAAQFDENLMTTLLAVVPTESIGAFRQGGDFNMSPAGLLRFATDKATAPYVYCGIHVTTPDVVEDWPLEAFSLAMPWRDLAKEGRLHGSLYTGRWADMGTPAGLEAAHTIAAAQTTEKKRA